jgi:ribonuclease VapC
MMVIDVSALVAILLCGPQARDFISCIGLEDAGCLISPVPVFESVAAVVRQLPAGVKDARVLVRDLLSGMGIAIEPVSEPISEEAITAFDRFGKGRHPAALNMGDCYAYALAKSLRQLLLFKGGDFGQTDIECVAI